MLNNKIPVVGYIRCSTDMQEESPEQQKKEILKFAEKNSFEIIEWFIDFGKSGTTFEQRPEFQKLKSIVENNPKFKAVICYDSSRWSRAIDPEEGTFYRVWFKKHSVEVLFVKTSVDPKNEFAPMLQAFEGIQASSYSKKLSELTLRGAVNNGVYSSGGTAPYGYKRIAVNLKTGIERELNEGEWCVKKQEKVKWKLGIKEEVETVRYIFQQRSKELGFLRIAKNLNDKNTPCPKRGRWRNKDQKWSAVTIKTIIENPVYYGARAYNKMSSSKIQAQAKGRDVKSSKIYPSWKNDKADWVIVENAHEAIVSKELWIKANEILSERKPISIKKYSSQYLLTGLVYCSRCGFAFQGWSTSAYGNKYLKYADGGWKNKRVCSHLAIPKEQLEDFAINAVKDTIADLKVARKVEEKLLKLLENKPAEHGRKLKEIEQELLDNKTRIDNIVKAIELSNGMNSLSSLMERLKILEGEREMLIKKQLEERQGLEAQSNHIDVSGLVKSFVSNFEEEFEKSPIEERKLLIRKCISSIVVDREKKVARFFVRRIPIADKNVESLYPSTHPSEFMDYINGGRRSFDKSTSFVSYESARSRSFDKSTSFVSYKSARNRT